MYYPRIVYRKPFIWPLLKLVFRDKAWHTGIAVTIGNTIYTNRFMSETTWRHEMCHVEQQKGSALYAYFYYIPRYIIDRRFRERMEAEAYAAEKES
jgi:hypothetical protein